MQETVLKFVPGANRSQSDVLWLWYGRIGLVIVIIWLIYDLITTKHPGDVFQQNKSTLGFLAIVIAFVVWSHFRIKRMPKPDELRISDNGIALYVKNRHTMSPSKILWRINKPDIEKIDLEAGSGMIVIVSKEQGTNRNRILLTKYWTEANRLTDGITSPGEKSPSSSIPGANSYNIKAAIREQMLQSDVGRALTKHGLIEH